jgi:hypothetical protein
MIDAGGGGRAAQPDTLLPVRLYRGLLSEGARRWVSERISADRRHRVVMSLGASRLARTVGSAKDGLVLRRAASLGASQRAVVLDSAGRRRVAVIRPRPTPLLVRRELLDDVLRALDGLPVFCLRGLDPARSVVAVSDDCRDQALAALGQLVAHEPVYVSAIDGRPSCASKAELRPAWTSNHADLVPTGAVAARLVRFVTDPSRRLVLGEDESCDIEFWPCDGEGGLRAPRPNRVVDTLTDTAPVVDVEENVLTALAPRCGAPALGCPPPDRCYPVRAGLDAVLIDDVTFPIDAVYTWVDGSDPVWIARRDEALAEGGRPAHRQAANDSRFYSRDELRYSLRSLEAYAPWIRTVWLVTDDQVPDWLNRAHPRLRVVSHRELFGDRGRLPTFNSHAIETQLHRIEGLAEHFLYFNDDVFLGRPLTPLHFFEANGTPRFFPSSAKVGLGAHQPEDPPVVAAAKNNRRLIEASFGRLIVHRLRHVPHPQRRSLLQEIAQRYPAEIAATAGHQFRHPDDVSLPSALAPYYGYATGRAVPGDLCYSYTDVSGEAVARRLRVMLTERRLDVFCLNDTASEQSEFARQHQLMNWFLDAYYPVPSEFEQPVSGKDGGGVCAA